VKKKLVLKKNLESQHIPSSAELLEIYEVKAGNEKLFSLYVKRYSRAMQADEG
jgi:hypothetical protein